MKKIISSIFLFFVFQIYILGQIPVGYYNPIDGKQERDLKTALHRILKEHTVLSYNNLWYYFRTTDLILPDIVWDMYSSNVRYYDPPTNSNSSVSGMNKEHSLPKSWWDTSPANEQYAAYSDLNNLFPSDGSANMSKSNIVLGKVNNPTFNNGVTKTGQNNYPGSPATRAFEPADEYKGDFARTYMYMVTCYEDYAPQWRTEALQMLNNETYPVFQEWAKQMLLEWHRNDPVSEKEKMRNEEVYRYQNNRNPFIDFPQLAEYIWGDSVAYTFDLSDQYIAHTPVLTTPVNRTDLFFGAIQKDEEVSQSIVVKGHNLNLTLPVKLALDKNEKNHFSVETNTVPASNVNSEEGYDLEIFYHPQDYGEHKAELIIWGGGIGGSYVVYLKGICANPSGIIPADAQFPDLYIQNNVINFRTYSPNDKVFIYNPVGKLIFSETGTSKWQQFKCPQSGIHIIQLNGKTQKILVNE